MFTHEGQRVALKPDYMINKLADVLAAVVNILSQPAVGTCARLLQPLSCRNV